MTSGFWVNQLQKTYVITEIAFEYIRLDNAVKLHVLCAFRKWLCQHRRGAV